MRSFTPKRWLNGTAMSLRGQRMGEKKEKMHINFSLQSTTNWIIIPGGVIREDINNNTGQSESNKMAHHAAADSL